MRGVGSGTRLEALKAAYGDALGQEENQRDLGNLPREQLTQFRYVTGSAMWQLIRAAIA